MATYTLEIPVAPGEMVYVLDPCYCTPSYIDDCRQRKGTSIRKMENRKCIAVFPTENKKCRAHCWKVYLRPFDPVKHLAFLGKRVFKTQEEAFAMVAKEGETKE